jgi:hypothetical protein
MKRLDLLLGMMLTLIPSAALGHVNPAAVTIDDSAHYTSREKFVALKLLVDASVDCVAGVVAKDPRLHKAALNDLIIDSFASCVEPTRKMIDAHDRYYGVGSGHQYFMGPYLDSLPQAVTSRVQ